MAEKAGSGAPVKRGMLKLKGGKTASDIVNNLKTSQEMLKKRTIEEAMPKEYLQYQKKTKEEEVRKEEINKLANQEVTSGIQKTRSEEAFEIIQKKRFLDRAESELKMTHREKLEKFNKNLSSLPEHFDIPKVGPG